MIKRLLIASSFVFFAHAMELQLMGPYDRYDLEVHLNRSEEDLTRSYEARELGWVPAMYDASGLQDRMSKECFMVNALREIKERMAIARCCPELQDCVSDRPCVDSNDCESLFMGANLIGSTAAFAVTLAMAANAKMPLPFPERLVTTSCFMAQVTFNYTKGMEWAHSCIITSMKFDTPCNVTAAREEFNRNGGGLPQPSFCCYGIADQKCHEIGVDYNKNIYPELRQQAQWDAWKPFLIACPAILAVQLGYIGGKKLRRYLRQRPSQPFCVATGQSLLMQAEQV